MRVPLMLSHITADIMLAAIYTIYLRVFVSVGLLTPDRLKIVALFRLQYRRRQDEAHFTPCIAF
jgi:hypothetical protein